MAASPLTASAFALTAGRAADPRALFAVEPISPTRTAIVAVESLDPSPRGVELAMLGRATMLEALRRAPTAEPALALGRAYAAANAHVLVENRPSAGALWERRSHVGATAILVEGTSVTLGQVPPGQALVVQDGACFAFPDLRTWEPDYAPDRPTAEPDPLGFGETTRPSLFRTVAAPGDLIVLCSAEVGRLLSRQSRRERAAREAALAAGDADRVLDLLERLVVAGDLSDATAAVIAVGGERGAARAGGIRRLSFPLRRAADAGPLPDRDDAAPAARSGERAAAKAPAAAKPATAPARPARPETPRPAPARETAMTAPDRPGGRARRPAAATAERGGRPAMDAFGAPRTPLPRRVAFRVVLPDSLRLGLLAAAEAVMPRRRLAPLPAAARPQSLAAPGAGSIQRHREHGGLPAEWYANLPRGFDVPISRPWLAVSLAVLLAVSGARYVVERERGAASATEAAVVRLDDALAAAAARGPDPVGRVVAAQAAYDRAVAAGATTTQLASRAAALDLERAATLGALSVGRVQALGALPADVGATPRLLVDGDTVFVLGDALYSVDATRPTLVRLLAAGDSVQGQAVGPLRLGGADRSGVVVGDGTSAFARSNAGIWQRAELGTSDGIDVATAPFGEFDGALYTVDPARGILKLPTQAGEAPLVWASVDRYPDLAAARDLAVDGSVRVLLDDGRLMTFYQHVAQSTVLPEVTPPLEQPAFLARAAGSTAVYVVDPATAIGTGRGRIVRVAADGSVRQIVLPTSGAVGSLLARATSVAVDERAGAVYLLADGQLWRFEVPDLPTVAVDPPMPGI